MSVARGLAPRYLPRSALLLAAAVVCAACPQRTAVWVANGSTARHLVLRMADVRGGNKPVAIGVLRVDRCNREPTGDGAMWLVGPRGGTAPWRVVTYGVTPPNGVSDEGPHPLAPGCYQVTISGTGRTVFDVAPDGRVTERPSSQVPAL